MGSSNDINAVDFVSERNEVEKRPSFLPTFPENDEGHPFPPSFP